MKKATMSELSRFQSVSLNSDRSVDVDYPKVQMDNGPIHVGETTDCLDSYTYSGKWYGMKVGLQ